MQQADVDAFMESAGGGPISKVYADLGDLNGRLGFALNATNSIKVLRKNEKNLAKQKMIDGHVKEIESLQPLAKTMYAVSKKFMQLKPDKYFDMQQLLEKNIKFFHTANRFLDQATQLRASITRSGMLLYNNPHMTVIEAKIGEIQKTYDDIKISYRKHGVKLTGTG